MTDHQHTTERTANQQREEPAAQLCNQDMKLKVETIDAETISEGPHGETFLWIYNHVCKAVFYKLPERSADFTHWTRSIIKIKIFNSIKGQ